MSEPCLEFSPQTGPRVDIGNGCAEMPIGYRVPRHTGAAINTEGDTMMQYCLLMHYQEGGEIGLTGSGLRKRASNFMPPGEHFGVARRLGCDHPRIACCNNRIAVR
jgi:hypothetical protein